MKRIGITVALLFCMGTVSLFAQAYKVVEKSDKKAPVWYESAESGYIVASAETGSMEEARQQCLESVKRQIIQAVAQNVEFSDSHTVKQTSGNGVCRSVYGRRFYPCSFFAFYQGDLTF